MDKSFRSLSLFLLVCYFIIQIVSFSIPNNRNLGPIERAIVFLTAPVQNLGTKFIGFGSDLINHYIFLSGVAKQNKVLLKQIQKYELEKVKYQEIELENRRLLSLLSLEAEYILDLQGARRVASGVSPYQRLIRIKFDEDSKLQPRTAVVHPKGVVGQLIQVHGNLADVLLLVDKVSAIDVINQRTRQRAILRGDTFDLLRFEYLPIGTDIREGDELLSSGLDGIYPKGIPVAFVSEVGERNKQMFLEAYAKPYVDFLNIEEVGVIRPSREQE